MGIFLLTFTFIGVISTYSFTRGTDPQNILGKVGESLGWIFLAFWGLAAYPLFLFVAWWGWRKLFAKSIQRPIQKLLLFIFSLTSLSLLLSAVEAGWPNLYTSLQQTFFTGLWRQKRRFHLGGAPFFYLYRDIPHLSIAEMINHTGAFLLFSLFWLWSLKTLFKISLRPFVRFLQSLRKPKEVSASDVEILPSTPTDILRFVKLRMPLWSSWKGSSTQDSGQELLEIHPEKNITSRPSLSRKSPPPLSFEEKEERSSLWEPPPSPKETFPGSTDDEDAPFRSIPKKKKLSPPTKRQRALRAQAVHNGDFSHFQLPPPALLTATKKIDTTSLRKDLKRQAEVLEETLFSFGIEAKVGQINCGPTITSFEVHPSIGVKVQKIRALANDIALNMEARSIRIIAPIPGKAAVGIEIPNPHPQEVGFHEMLLAYKQGRPPFHIPILLGKAVNGDYVMSDLAKMPHCIIAGATGSGKSVCINTIVMSILMNAKPNEVKLLMVDPKKVELTPYTELPHMLAPVITEPQGAVNALRWLVKEMENRYDILKLLGVRNIDAFNSRQRDIEKEATLDKEIPEKMYYIVLIIDELADLMMVSSNDIETPIARIAQMARAVGIHAVLATQRPSREVITGLIKANFPTRISFKVASRVNSQIILDEIGAESLLGNGDLLFLPPGTSHLTRAQGAYIRDHDIQSVIEKIQEQAPPQYIIDSFDDMQSNASFNDDDDEPDDNLYQEAFSIVTGTGNASTTFLQRKLKIGYARAASLMDELERRGIVSQQEGSKARKVLRAKGSSQEDDALEEEEAWDD